MRSVVTRSFLVAAATALVGGACRDSLSLRPIADLSAGGVRITGVGQIGSSSVTYGSSYDSFTFDVRSDLTGTMSYTETGVRSDGTVVTLVVDPLDPATHHRVQDQLHRVRRPESGR